MIDYPRLSAHKAILRVLEGGYSNIVFSETLKTDGMAPRDKAFFSRLFWGVLERKISLEFILGKFLKSPPPKSVSVALMMGLYQYLFLDSVPEFAAVNSSLELIKSPKLRGLANAVLRNAIREGKDALLKSLEQKESLKYSVSEEVYKTLKESLGEEAKGFLEAANEPPKVFIKVNSRLISTEELSVRFEKKGIKTNTQPIENALSVEFSGDILSLPEYKEGLFFIEDLSSQMAVFALDLEENDLVLDLCAAPGGKSFSAALKAKAVHSFDIYPEKVKLLSENAKRLSLPVIAAVQSAEEIGDRREKYDKVICDVPCSGIGVLRRKPEIRYKSENIDELILLQRRIMLTAADAVKKGGKILYSTCSVNKRENEENLNWLLKKRPDLSLLTQKTVLPKEYNSDGFYFAVIERCL